ncbi:MAG: DNA binding protein [crAssphage sp. isolate ctbg_1]|uniref:DNA binding protein n=1 Tax=crAssphage sp. isolate ctbg_1 TaxID=2989854 RepID=A0A345MT18_9CAUD|nr:MAG: DNA binding protein [crAssphage sp. isolate ctbg_1]AXH74518.1 MAG: DNA binding protein [crAssphage sp. isolate ctbg_1]
MKPKVFIFEFPIDSNVTKRSLTENFRKGRKDRKKRSKHDTSLRANESNQVDANTTDTVDMKDMVFMPQQEVDNLHNQIKAKDSEIARLRAIILDIQGTIETLSADISLAL